MIKQLRKRHLQIWSMLLVLLPVSIISAKLAIRKPVMDRLLQPAASTALPILVKTVEKENYTINLRTSNDSSFQLEFMNKSVLTIPTATIYTIAGTGNDIKNGELIGRIEARGVYRFALKKNILGNHLVLYDFIQQRVFDTIHF